MGAKQDKNSNKDDVREDISEQRIPDLHETIKELESVRSELEQVRNEQASLDNQLKRAVADYQNLEKRISEGRSELTTWATGNLISQILPVLDNLEKAMVGMSDEEKKSGWAKGVEMSVKQLKEVLKSEGLEQITIEAGGQFDPALHEAVDTRVGENDKILEVVTKGYNLNGKVLRPAKVVVGRKDNNE
jgi:molecular chaperone GrpE